MQTEIEPLKYCEFGELYSGNYFSYNGDYYQKLSGNSADKLNDHTLEPIQPFEVVDFSGESLVFQFEIVD